MKLLITITTTLLLNFTALAQDSLETNSPAENHLKTNPIIFLNMNFGAGVAGLKGLCIGGTLNYQIKNSIITARLSGIANFSADVVSPFVPLPVFRDRDNINEGALMYGYRKIIDNKSLSFSMGLSYNHRTRTYRNEDEEKISYKTRSRYAGVPFEFNIAWFNRNKKRYRIYYIIPVGKPIGFSRSIGFKLYGNISKNSYAALGLVYGWGFHKQY